MKTYSPSSHWQLASNHLRVRKQMTYLINATYTTKLLLQLWYRREEPECGVQIVSAVDVTENQELITGV
jgi:hypothetical protein